MSKPIQIYQTVQFADRLFIFFSVGLIVGGGEQILVKRFAGLVCVYKNIMIECHVQVWNIWMLILFVLPPNGPGGGGIFFY